MYRFMFYDSFIDSCVLCFLFKQEPAYAMRISDWSSDVCSSDLIDRFPIKQWPAFGRHGAFDNISPGLNIDDWDVIEEAVIAAAYPLHANAQRVQAGMDELYLPIARTGINNSGVPGATNIGRQWPPRTPARGPWGGGRMGQRYQVIQIGRAT